MIFQIFGVPRGFQNLIVFRILFLSILAPSWPPTWSHLGPQDGLKSRKMGGPGGAWEPGAAWEPTRLPKMAALPLKMDAWTPKNDPQHKDKVKVSRYQFKINIYTRWQFSGSTKTQHTQNMLDLPPEWPLMKFDNGSQRLARFRSKFTVQINQIMRVASK